MKKTQSLFSLALALALILSLAGCGGSASDSAAAEATRPEYAVSEEATDGITSEEIAAVGVQAQQSEQDKINRSSYNDEAREFNARLGKFPVNLLLPLVGVEPLATYNQE